MLKTLTAATLAIVALAYAADGNAAQIVNSGTGLAAPDVTITFDEVVLAGGAPLTNQYSAFGVTFTNMFYGSENQPAPNMAFPYAENFFNETLNPFSIHFTSDVNAAAFSMITNAGTSSFAALLDGVVIDSFTAPTDLASSNNFFGFTGFTFDEIRIVGGGPEDSDGPAGIDNIQFNVVAVPAPASLALLASGLLALGAFARRKTA